MAKNEMSSIEIPDMINTLKINIKNLAEILNNDNKSIRDGAKEVVELHWELIDQLDQMDHYIAIKNR